MTAGIGNRMNLNSVENNYRDFKILSDFNNVVMCWATCCMLFLYSPFMELWAGKDNLLDESAVLVFSGYFYIYQSRKIVLLYKDAAGLWREDQLKPLLGAGLNLIINIVLVQSIGITGVIISSIASFILVEIPWESHTLYKCYFHKKAKEYFFHQVKWFALCIPIWLLVGELCSLVKTTLLMELIIKGIICAIVPLPYIWLITRKNKELHNVFYKIVPIGKIRRKKNNL